MSGGMWKNRWFPWKYEPAPITVALVDDPALPPSGPKIPGYLFYCLACGVKQQPGSEGIAHEHTCRTLPWNKPKDALDITVHYEYYAGTRRAQAMRYTSDGGIELDGVKLTKAQVEQIKAAKAPPIKRTGWWVVDIDYPAIGAAYLGTTIRMDPSSERYVLGENGLPYAATRASNVIYWGTF